MGLEKTKSHVGLGKIAIVLLGAVCMGVVLHSHFESDWKAYQTSCSTMEGSMFTMYKICQLNEDVEEYKKCPGISMEQFLVAVIIMCFTISLANLTLFLFSEMLISRRLKFADIGYHVLSAVLLLAAGIAYIISAEQIAVIIEKMKWDGGPPTNFLRGEKIFAGCLAAALSLLYGTVALLIFRKRESH